MDPSTATALWHQLENGSWCVVDQLDRDECRYVLAQEGGGRALTRREREVVEHASRGWSNKLIAYELGVATSTVSTHLSHAAAKLGLASRSAVIQTFAALAARPGLEVTVKHLFSAGKRFAVIAIPLRSTLPQGLSSAERDVVVLAIAGKSNVEIALARLVSRRTVENQLASAMKKVGARSRAELVALLLTSGP